MKKARILIVDDEECIRFTFRQFLTDADYDVSATGDFDTAVSLALEEHYDLDTVGKPPLETNLYSYVDTVGKPPFNTNLYQYASNSPVNYIDPLGLFEFVYEAGGSIWFPGSAGAYSGEVGSKWKSPYSEGPQYRGYSDNFTIGSLADIGARAGIKGLSGCDEGKETSVNVGLGKYLGLQIHFRNGRFDGITTGFGIGLALPVTYSVPFEDFISAYD